MIPMVIKTMHSITGFYRTAIPILCNDLWPSALWWQLLPLSASRQVAERRCCSEQDYSYGGQAKPHRSAIALQSKVLWSTDLDLWSLKSMECVCGHKLKCGEVHRWRGRWVQTLECGMKLPERAVWTSPVFTTLIGEHNDKEAEMCFQTRFAALRKQWRQVMWWTTPKPLVHKLWYRLEWGWDR